jgi:hypothetical protein
MNLIRQTRGGENYNATFHQRMRGTGVFADLIAARFDRAVRKLHLNKKSSELRTDLFRVPTAQLSLDW